MDDLEDASRHGSPGAHDLEGGIRNGSEGSGEEARPVKPRGLVSITPQGETAPTDPENESDLEAETETADALGALDPAMTDPAAPLVSGFDLEADAAPQGALEVEDLPEALEAKISSHDIEAEEQGNHIEDATVGTSDGEGAPSRTSVLAWFRVVGGAVVFALALRLFAFEAYRIPSTSMEDTLLVGDFVLVSKLHFGARVQGHRVPGFTSPQRGDVCVFNYPPSLDPDITGRTPYIKRVVGVPGDTLSIQGKTVRVGEWDQQAPASGRSLWEVRGELPRVATLDSLGLARRIRRVDEGVWVASATSRQASGLRAEAGVLDVLPYTRPIGDGSASFPAARRYSLDDYGPIVVPARGQTIVLDDASLPVVRTVIERFEGHTVERSAQGVLVDGIPTTSFTFTQDYYFVMGDSRDDSADSRIWGFVPFDHMIGKAVVVYFSWDQDEGHTRWDRIGNGMNE